MASEAMHSNHLQNLQAHVEQDLLEAYLYDLGISLDDSDDISEDEMNKLNALSKDYSYPWKPGDVGAEDLLNTLDQEFSLDDWQTEEVMQRSKAFFGKIDELWNTVPLQVTLAQRFSAYISQDLVATIVQAAQQVLSGSQSLADQLVHCVQAIQINLAEEDLQLLARPYANAMRGAEAIQIRSDWDNLSEPERARLALMIARSAIDELNKQA
jgi:hypothetical protein